MMDLQKEILGLSIAFALLAALLLVIALRARIPWPFKLAMVLVTSAYYCVAFFRIEGLSGWSATTSLPPQFQLLWARVVEPNPLDRDPGAVHIWVEQLDAANLPSGEPRAHRLPYSASLAAKVEAGCQLVYHAAWLDAQGVDCTREVSMVKAYCGELVNEVMYSCLQFHGGMGFMRESTIERMARDARVQNIGGGATEVMLEEVAKRLRR